MHSQFMAPQGNCLRHVLVAISDAQGMGSARCTMSTRAGWASCVGNAAQQQLELAESSACAYTPQTISTPAFSQRCIISMKGVLRSRKLIESNSGGGSPLASASSRCRF